MIQFLVTTLSWPQFLWLPLRLIGGWSLLGLCVWTLVHMVLSVIIQAKKMHQIPCAECRFFTGDYRLKCPVNPHAANTEEAIGCRDYQGF